MLVFEKIKNVVSTLLSQIHYHLQTRINREQDLNLLCPYDFTSIVTETPSEDFTVTVEGGGFGTVIWSLKTWLVPWRTIGPWPIKVSVAEEFGGTLAITISSSPE
ncbi:MAG: hypothetical protein KAT23_09955 [Anaerolineales bacterium]|nr:hypothetical protein [Anaerolineales bacterium]